MNRINVLILDDISAVGNNVRLRIFADNNRYKNDLGLEIFPQFCNEIKDKTLNEAARIEIGRASCRERV